MAKLTASQRKKLPSSAFAIPGKRAFPIHNRSHAKAALSMLHYATPAEQATIKRKIKRRYPDMDIENNS
jgi:hypothetical protein